ncbi:MAG: MarR family winged helix-turn-helix transcriptional regulator [Candidatus Cryosericum sp.]|jgi:MarR family transcriptional regulator, organic hydroperoxide resistance regulator
MKETAAELESLLRDISYWIKKKGRDALSSVRITLPQFQVLQLVYFGEAVNVKDLTRLTGLAASTVSEMVDRLVELMYITKTQNEIDKRQVILKCTKQGASIIRKVIRQRVQSVQEITGRMKPGSADYLVAVLTEFVELCK